jgi:hypothetical protein
MSCGQPSTWRLTARGLTFAYRELGPVEDTPVALFVHPAGTLDDGDPRADRSFSATRDASAETSDGGVSAEPEALRSAAGAPES